jgi:hypothetical protein
VYGLELRYLTEHVKFPDKPDERDTISEFDMLLDEQPDMYGTRLTGYLIPPVTGDYTFYIASDNEGVLFLSEDDDPTNKKPVARVPIGVMWRGWGTVTPPEAGDELGYASAPIRLEAGRHYYVEVQHKESDQGDHVAVTWQLPGQPPPSLGDPPIPGRYLACQDDGESTEGQ